MNAPYVCMRCSRRIIFYAHCQLRQSSFIPHDTPTGQGNGVDLPPPGERSNDGTSSKLSKQPDQGTSVGLQGLQNQRIPTDVDRFLKSLFTSNQNQLLPTRSRYSRKEIAPAKTSIAPVEKAIVTSERKPGHDTDVPTIEASPILVSEYPKKSKEKQNRVEVEAFAITQQLVDLQRRLHDESATLEETWQSCDEIIKSHSWKANIRSEKLKGTRSFAIFRDLLREITRRRSISVNGKIIFPVDVIAAYQFGRVLKFWWHDLLWIQLGNILKASQKKDVKEAHNSDAREFEALLQDILQVWKAFMQAYYSFSETGSPLTSKLSGSSLIRFKRSRRGSISAQKELGSWGGLSLIADHKGITPVLPRLLSQRFEALLGTADCGSKLKHVASAAVLTLHYVKVFKAEHPSQSGLLADAEPFVEFLTRVAQDSDWDCPNFKVCLSDVAVATELVDRAAIDWARSPVNAVRNSVLVQDPLVGLRKEEGFTWTEQRIERLFRDLNHIKDSSDATEAAKLWRRVKPVFNPTLLKNAETRNQVFARFLSTLLAARQNEQAIDVWNHMINTGHKPGLNHWNAMMHGCNVSKDFSSLSGIWSNMLRANVQPDNELWATYIHGVIKANKWQQGLGLLEQLGREWKLPKINTLTPSLGPVHGALSGLLQIGRKGMLSTVIDWARSQGLQPTVHTYNILLRPLARSGTPQEIRAHLETMMKNSCQPDIFTYNMILNGLVHSEHSPFYKLTKEEQNASIESLLKDLRTNNMEPTPHTYNAVLNGLLDSRYHDPNIPAARSIINHMHAAGIYPSPHTHVIVLSYYFSLSPPDLAAIDSLLHTLLHNPSTAPKNLDHIFYDRLIVEFAKIDEYEKALRFMRKMVGEGKAPSWASLLSLLRSLRRAEEWDLCAEVVDGIESGEIMRWGGDRRGGSVYSEFLGEVDDLRLRGVIPGTYECEG